MSIDKFIEELSDVSSVTAASDSDILITEGVTNIFTKKSDSVSKLTEEKKEYIWQMIQTSYEAVGGYPAKSLDEILDDCDMLKIISKNSKILAVIAYKFKYGKKSILSATISKMPGVTKEDKLDALKALSKAIVDGVKYSNTWAEISGPMVSFIKRACGGNFKIVKSIFADALTGKEILEKFDDDASYARYIGGIKRTKLIYGNPKFDDIEYVDDLENISLAATNH